MNNILGAGGAGFALTPLMAAFARTAHAAAPRIGFGPLSAKMPLNSAALPPQYRDVAFISLPPRFDYKVISTTGEIMDDGNPVAAGHDGMAAFRGCGGQTLLVRNHELRTSNNPVIVDLSSVYNPSVHGGTSNLVVDARGNLVNHYNSLGGTERNCAGGPTPWGSWLTCEETFATRDGVRHGYVFDVPSDGLGDPTPIIGLGRFSHEAAAVDPATGYVYLTEDRGNSVFYRFRPEDPSNLHGPGQLEALRILDWPEGVDTSDGFLSYLGVPFQCDWVPVDEPNPEADNCREQGIVQGAAIFSRGEGCWYGDGVIYFCSTDGGDQNNGQVFAYDPSCDTVTLFIESTDPTILDNPDNITVGPNGRLYMFEDGGGTQNIVGATLEGDLFLVASNVYNSSEFAGGCFSHNGRFLFVNVQTPGLTLVIEGPWHSKVK
jgi:secreted PhoX family phosphatase